MSFSVVIPSKNTRNLSACVDAVYECEPHARIIVVNDGLEATTLRSGPGEVQYVPGVQPFIFARNINIGIRTAGRDDVVLLNDDALLKTPGGFTRLQQIGAQHADIGIVAPVTNVTGQPLQKPQGVGLRQVPHIAFVCVFIPRRTLDMLGPLDERYCIDYGVEDRDYCEAVNRAGLKVCVYDDVYVSHDELHSTFRGDPHTPRPFIQNWQLFCAKWGPTDL